MSLSSKNIFAALDTKKKKKSSKSSKEPSDKKKKKDEKPEKAQLPPQQHLFASKTEDLQASNWADTDEEDDFDVQIQPLPASWLEDTTANGGDHKEEDASESEDEDTVNRINAELGLEIGDDEAEEDDADDEDEGNDDAIEGQQHNGASESVSHEASTQPAAQPERQLSKKEKKKLEIEEMNRVLAELGIEPTPEQNSEEVTQDESTDKPIEQGTVPGEEPAVIKKKKKKDKTKTANANVEPKAEPEAEPEPKDSSEPKVLDPAEAKKMLARKKAGAAKKTSTTSASATLAAKEAKERASKKAKLKDKKNYNQAPTR